MTFACLTPIVEPLIFDEEGGSSGRFPRWLTSPFPSHLPPHYFIFCAPFLHCPSKHYSTSLRYVAYSQSEKQSSRRCAIFRSFSVYRKASCFLLKTPFFFSVASQITSQNFFKLDATREQSSDSDSIVDQVDIRSQGM